MKKKYKTSLKERMRANKWYQEHKAKHKTTDKQRAYAREWYHKNKAKNKAPCNSVNVLTLNMPYHIGINKESVLVYSADIVNKLMGTTSAAVSPNAYGISKASNHWVIPLTVLQEREELLKEKMVHIMATLDLLDQINK